MTKLEFAMYTAIQSSLLAVLLCLLIAAKKIPDSPEALTVCGAGLVAIWLPFLVQFLYWKKGESTSIPKQQTTDKDPEGLTDYLL